MTIQECIQETVKYLDGVYKDGPHFRLTDDTPENQMEELIEIYKKVLIDNLDTLARAYLLKIEDKAVINKHGWVILPDIPEDKIENITVKSGDVVVSISIAEINGKWLSQNRFKSSFIDDNGKLGCCSLMFGSRKSAIDFTKRRCSNFAEFYSDGDDEKKKAFSKNMRNCAEQLEKYIENEQQGMLF